MIFRFAQIVDFPRFQFVFFMLEAVFAFAIIHFRTLVLRVGIYQLGHWLGHTHTHTLCYSVCLPQCSCALLASVARSAQLHCWSCTE